MNYSRRDLALLVPALTAGVAAAQQPTNTATGRGAGGRGASGRGPSGPPEVLGAKVYDYAELEKGLKTTGNSPRALNTFLQGITTRGLNLEMHTSNLPPGKESPAGGHKHIEEEIMIVVDGTVAFELDGKMSQPVGRGTLCFVASNVEHLIRNVGTTDARYNHITIIGSDVPIGPVLPVPPGSKG